MNIDSSESQQTSRPEKVIVVCPNCSQKLRSPVNLGKLRILCSKCKHNWFWSPDTNISNQIERIKEKIGRARQLHIAENQAYPEFYSSTNPNRGILTFKPPLSAYEIDAWETRHNVCLPEEYRSFLEQIGNGGQFYQDILPLEEWAIGLGFDDEDQALQALSQPCLLLEEYESDWAWQQWLMETIGQDWEETYEQGLWSPMFGMITVGREQGGSCCYLVLNGSLKGHICWFLPEWAALPCFEPSTTFLDWFEMLLDKDLDEMED